MLIIGGGTGGMCLAQGLHQAGVPVTVYERDRTGPTACTATAAVNRVPAVRKQFLNGLYTYRSS